MRNGVRASLDLHAFSLSVEDALAISDAGESASRLSSLGRAWLTGVLDGRAETTEPARRCFAAALSLHVSGSNTEAVANDHYNLGAAFLLSEPLETQALYEALSQFESVFAVIDQVSNWLAASAYSSATAAMRHLALAGLEPYEKVRELALKAVSSWRSHGEPEGLAKALLNAGNAQVDDPAGDPEENASLAFELYNEAIHKAVEAKDAVLEASCRTAAALALRDRASYQPEQDLADAAELLDQSRLIYEQNEMYREWAEVVIETGGVLVHERSRYHRGSAEITRTAIVMLEDALVALGTFPENKRRASGYFYLGQAWLELQWEDGDEARERAVAAFKTARRLRRRSASDLEMAQLEEAQANALSEGSSLRDHSLAARLYRKAVKRLDDGYPVQRFRMLCNSAFGRMQVGQWRSAAITLRKAAKLATESELLDMTRRGLFREGRISECFSALAVCEAEMGHVSRAVESLEKSRDLSRQKGHVAIDLAALLAARREDLIVLPILSPVRSIAIVIPPNATSLAREHLVELPGMEKLQASIQPYRSRGEDGFLAKVEHWRADLSPQGQQFRQSFLEQLLEELWTGFVVPALVRGPGNMAQIVTIVPQGGFHILPIHAARTSQHGAYIYACDRWTFRYVPTFASAFNSGSTAAGPWQAPLFVGLSHYRDPRLRRLTLAEVEADQAVESLGFEKSECALTGPRATRETVLEKLYKADLIHFACHATLSRDPAASAIQLWASTSGERSTLTVAEVEASLRPSGLRLVVMSACDSGVMEHMFAADELAGLPTAFLRAGSGGVISSLWAVNDLASYFLWPRFYEELRNGLSAAEALNRSCRWLRKRTREELHLSCDSPLATRLLGTRGQASSEPDRPFSHPWMWATFVYYGQ